MARLGCQLLGFAVAILAGVLAAPAGAAAEGIVVATGPERGSYHHIGERLKTELLVSHGRRIEVLKTAGSLENLRRLDDPQSPVNVALSQADVFSAHAAAHPDFAARTVVLGDVGKECAFVIASAKGSAASLAELGAGDVSVGSGQSGARATLESMIRLAPGLARLRPVPVPTLEALVRLAQGAPGDGLVAALMVQRPRRVSPGFEVVLARPDDYSWIPIREGDVGRGALPDGRPLYSFERVRVGGSRGGGLEVETLCTEGVLLAARGKLSARERTMLAERLLAAGERIIGRDE